MQAYGYDLYENNAFPYNLNIFGVRAPNSVPNEFNDALKVLWQSNYHGWEHRHWPITTLPGIPWLKTPMNPKGTAILVPGRYQAAYELGTYRGYTALRQVKPVKVYRDNNQDSAFDMNPATIEEGFFGIHIHRAGLLSKIVGLSSAGCQVFQNKADFDEFIDLCKKSARHWGNRFTYTLVQL